MAPPLHVPKHFKFKLFFSVEPNPNIEPMAHVGSSSCQGASSSKLESIRVGTKACSHSNTNLENNKSFGMEPLNSFKPFAKKKPKRFYEKNCAF